jgi:hypothetical protein
VAAVPVQVRKPGGPHEPGHPLVVDRHAQTQRQFGVHPGQDLIFHFQLAVTPTQFGDLFLLHTP